MMTITEIIRQEIAQDYLFPNYPNTFAAQKNGVQANTFLNKIRRRLAAKDYVPNFFPSEIVLEELPFYRFFPVKDGEDKDTAVIEKVLAIYEHDRDILLRAVDMVDSIESPLSIAFSLYSGRSYFNSFRDLSRKQGVEHYIITVDEIPDWTYNEGIEWMSKKMVSYSRKYSFKPEYNVEAPLTSTLEKEELDPLAQQVQELAKETLTDM